MQHTILVGSYSSEITALEFDTSTSPPTLSVSASFPTGKNPSWISPHPSDKSLLVAGNEVPDGKIQLFKFDQAQKTLELLGERPSGGADPAHILVLEDEIIVANYTGGTVQVVPLTLDPPSLGTPSQVFQLTGTSVNTTRQESSHPHQAVLHLEGHEVLVPDLGADKILRFAKENGKWVIKGSVDITPGAGPRHIVIYENKLYTVGELDNTLIVHEFPALPEEPRHITTLPTVRPPREADPAMIPAANILAPPTPTFPTPFIYVTNRNDPHPEGDSIAIYSLSSPDEASPGGVTLVNEVHTGMKHARGLAIGGPDDKYLIIGGVHGGGIKVFERTKGGASLKEVAKLEGVEKPTGFVWL
ncbi:hypothetical protein BOTBODRAFT_27670 [Botryobasidium botryosum FD-172 SS1]|uniref:Isomerase YbhE n=1 Tax=Botryobasidium botryosum (strain FD-172 SS1) TaxID=930990 RepID=A0A067MZY6_BOTB1|nr:hypothetical protein BOTBODRAFT_27670 [Botryobasidium botryosum FD-172 SS1]